MPVHQIASHDAEPIEKISNLTKPEDLLTRELLQSSFANKGADMSTVFSTANGFVNTITSAYNTHHRLILKFVNLVVSLTFLYILTS